nr:acyltransferase [Sphingomonas sp. ID1715]
MTQTHRFAALDALRGLCAVAVALFHFRTEGVLTNLAPIRRGWMFVDFFFVLSGFVIAHAYWERVGRGLSPWRFLGLRLGRIYPLHVAVLLLMLAAELGLAIFGGARDAFSSGRSLGDLAASLLMLHASGLTDRLVWNGPSWSIAAEFWAYVAFAALALTRRVWPFALLGLGAGLAMLAIHPDLYEASFDLGVVRCIYGFALGVLVWRLRSEPAWRPPVWLATVAELLYVAAIIGFTALVWGGARTLVAPILFAGVVYVFAEDAGMVSRVLKMRPLPLLGMLSYGIYMVHPFVQARLMEVLAKLGLARTGTPDELTAQGWTADAITLTMLALVVAAAAIVYRMIEAPARAFTRRRLRSSDQGDEVAAW